MFPRVRNVCVEVVCFYAVSFHTAIPSFVEFSRKFEGPPYPSKLGFETSSRHPSRDVILAGYLLPRSRAKECLFRIRGTTQNLGFEATKLSAAIANRGRQWRRFHNTFDTKEPANTTAPLFLLSFKVRTYRKFRERFLYDHILSEVAGLQSLRLDSHRKSLRPQQPHPHSELRFSIHVGSLVCA